MSVKSKKNEGAVGKGGVNPAPRAEDMTVRAAAEQLLMVPISDLVPYAKNARTHSSDQIELLRRSLREFGFVAPVLIDFENNIIAGHGRVEAARLEGMTEVPCVLVSNLSDAQRRAYILADNRLAELSGWDDGALRLEMEQLAALCFDTTVIGFDMADPPPLQFGPADPPPAAGKTVQIQHHARAAPGLGQRDSGLLPMAVPSALCVGPDVRLYHGDCLELMGHIPDSSVDAILCDLPYGVTDHPWDDILPIEIIFQEYRRVLKQKANVLLFCQQPFTTQLMNAAFSSEFSHSLVWVKNTKTRSMSSLTCPMAQHEEILVFRMNKTKNKTDHKELREYFNNELKKSGFSVEQLAQLIPNRSAHHWFRYSSDFRVPTEKNYRRLREITGHFSVPYEKIIAEFDENNEGSLTYNRSGENTDVLLFDTPNSRERSHPTQKPVALLEYLIRTYTNKGETVLDNTMGSGSTGVAAVHTGRRFIGMELDAEYFETAKKRIEKAKKGKSGDAGTKTTDKCD